MSAGDLARRAGPVERTGARAVAESLRAVAALARVPVIGNHLHRHLASPNARGALLLVWPAAGRTVSRDAWTETRMWPAPIVVCDPWSPNDERFVTACGVNRRADSALRDRKSTRLNSSHVEISYAVFCLKKKKKTYEVSGPSA